MKSEVYSWRVSADVKMELEREAGRRKMSISRILDMAAREWLKRCSADDNDNEEQRRLQRAAAKCFGAFAGGDPCRSENAREEVRRRLRQHNGR